MTSLDESHYQFITTNKNKPLHQVVLLLSKQPQLNREFILNQINGHQKAFFKLPTFAKNTNIIYPSPLSLEQCSSEIAANFKSSLVKGNSLLDLSGGFGVDAYFFSKNFSAVTYVEQNQLLVNIAVTNFKELGASNIISYCSSAEQFLASTKNYFDIVYIDPARRNNAKKVFQLDDCSPAILAMLPNLFSISAKILIKTAPMLDIKKAIHQLNFVEEVFVVSIKNDCKEVLYLLSKDAPKNSIKINTINLADANQIFSFLNDNEQLEHIEFSEPLNFLYEPNASIMKAGGFKSVANAFSVKKIAQHSHLYTSERLIENFPGRVFIIKNTLPYQVKLFKQLNLKKANVSCRNFLDNVDVVKKKLKISDGGDCYLFATTLSDKKPIVVLCEKI